MEALELQLMAHRKILTALMTIAAGDPDYWHKLMEHLRDDLVIQGHEEDPGVVPGMAFASQNALSEELRTIVSRAELRAGDRTRSE